MQIIKSNSSLIGFKNIYQHDSQFDLLQVVQSMSLSVIKNNTITKYIGNDLNLKNQFLDPDIKLDISYFQRNDFYNEKIFGFKFIHDLIEGKSAIYNLFNDEFNKGAFIIFSDLAKNDIINYIIKNGFSEDFLCIALDSLYLNEYSFSYSVGQVGLINCSFVGSNFNLSKLINNNGFKFRDFSKNEIPLDGRMINEFFSLSNNEVEKSLVYSTKYFNYSNNLDSESVSMIDVRSILDGIITNFDFSIDFNRSKYYFFESGNSPSNRKLISPLKYSLTVSGISSNLIEGDINKFKENKLFTFIIKVSDKIYEDSSYYEMIFENLTIENFSYDINLDGFLNYKLILSGDISKESGFKILQKNIDESIFSILNSYDNFLLKSNDNYNIISYSSGTGYLTINGVTGYYINNQLTTLNQYGNGAWNKYIYLNGIDQFVIANGWILENKKYFINGIETTLQKTGTGIWNGLFYIKGLIANGSLNDHYYINGIDSYPYLDPQGNGYWNNVYYYNGLSTILDEDGNGISDLNNDGLYYFFQNGIKGLIVNGWFFDIYYTNGKKVPTSINNENGFGYIQPYWYYHGIIADKVYFNNIYYLNGVETPLNENGNGDWKAYHYENGIKLNHLDGWWNGDINSTAGTGYFYINGQKTGLDKNGKGLALLNLGSGDLYYFYLNYNRQGLASGQSSYLDSNQFYATRDKYYLNGKLTTLNYRGDGVYENNYYLLGVLTTLDTNGNGWWSYYNGYQTYSFYYLNAIITSLDQNGNGILAYNSFNDNGIVTNLYYIYENGIRTPNLANGYLLHKWSNYFQQGSRYIYFINGRQTTLNQSGSGFSYISSEDGISSDQKIHFFENGIDFGPASGYYSDYSTIYYVNGYETDLPPNGTGIWHTAGDPAIDPDFDPFGFILFIDGNEIGVAHKNYLDGSYWLNGERNSFLDSNGNGIQRLYDDSAFNYFYFEFKNGNKIGYATGYFESETYGNNFYMNGNLLGEIDFNSGYLGGTYYINRQATTLDNYGNGLWQNLIYFNGQVDDSITAAGYYFRNNKWYYYNTDAATFLPSSGYFSNGWANQNGIITISNGKSGFNISLDDLKERYYKDDGSLGTYLGWDGTYYYINGEKTNLDENGNGTWNNIFYSKGEREFGGHYHDPYYYINGEKTNLDENGNGEWNNKFFINGELVSTGYYGGIYYINAEKTTLDENGNGVWFTSINPFGQNYFSYTNGENPILANGFIDGVYYLNGKISQLDSSGNGTLGGYQYFNGQLANGYISAHYWINGIYTILDQNGDGFWQQNLYSGGTKYNGVYNGSLYENGVKIIDASYTGYIYVNNTWYSANGSGSFEKTTGYFSNGWANENGNIDTSKTGLAGLYISLDDSVQRYYNDNGTEGTYTGWNGSVYLIATQETPLDSNGNGLWNGIYYYNGLQEIGGIYHSPYYYINGVQTTLDSNGNGEWNEIYYINGSIESGLNYHSPYYYINGSRTTLNQYGNGKWGGALYFNGNLFTGSSDGYWYIDGYIDDKIDQFGNGIVYRDIGNGLAYYEYTNGSASLYNGNYNGIFIQNGIPYTGQINDQYFQDGYLFSGQINDQYFENGSPFNGNKDGWIWVNGYKDRVEDPV